MNNTREKLIELQLQADITDNVSENTTQHRAFTADLMIANGVTVLPCKVGDTIFEVDPEHGVIKHEVYDVCVVYKTTATDDSGMEWDDFYTSDDIDMAYKTMDEAKASLAETTKGE